MNPAASVIVPIGDRIAGITRGRNTSDVNFPGGRADLSDRSPRITAVRELFEETGIKVQPDDLEEILVRADGAHVLFYAHRVAHWPRKLHSEPFEGWAGLYAPWAFLAPSSTYRGTAAEAFRRLGGLELPMVPEQVYSRRA